MGLPEEGVWSSLGLGYMDICTIRGYLDIGTIKGLVIIKEILIITIPIRQFIIKW